MIVEAGTWSLSTIVVSWGSAFSTRVRSYLPLSLSLWRLKWVGVAYFAAAGGCGGGAGGILVEDGVEFGWYSLQRLGFFFFLLIALSSPSHDRALHRLKERDHLTATRI